MARQSLSLPATWWRGGSQTRGWGRNIPNPDADGIEIDSALLPTGGSAFLADIFIDTLNRISLVFQQTASGSPSRADLSSAWETGGSVAFTVGTTTWTFQTDGDDTADNYVLTPTNTADVQALFAAIASRAAATLVIDDGVPTLAIGTITTSDASPTAGDTVTLTCPAPTGGTGAITYQWQENLSGTWTDISGATSQTYAPTSASAASRAFRCAATQGGDTVFTAAFTVTWAAAPPPTATLIAGTITSDDDTPTQGDRVTLTAGAPGGTAAGAITYAWEFFDGANWRSAAQTARTFSPTRTTGTGQWRVVYGRAGLTATSDAISITWSAATRVTPTIPPTTASAGTPAVPAPDLPAAALPEGDSAVVFDTPGPGSWTVPDGVSLVVGQLAGAGGGGGSPDEDGGDGGGVSVTVNMVIYTAGGGRGGTLFGTPSGGEGTEANGQPGTESGTRLEGGLSGADTVPALAGYGDGGNSANIFGSARSTGGGGGGYTTFVAAVEPGDIITFNIGAGGTAPPGDGFLTPATPGEGGAFRITYTARVVPTVAEATVAGAAPMAAAGLAPPRLTVAAIAGGVPTAAVDVSQRDAPPLAATTVAAGAPTAAIDLPEARAPTIAVSASTGAPTATAPRLPPAPVMRSATVTLTIRNIFNLPNIGLISGAYSGGVWPRQWFDGMYVEQSRQVTLINISRNPATPGQFTARLGVITSNRPTLIPEVLEGMEITIAIGDRSVTLNGVGDDSNPLTWTPDNADALHALLVAQPLMIPLITVTFEYRENQLDPTAVAAGTPPAPRVQLRAPGLSGAASDSTDTPSVEQDANLEAPTLGIGATTFPPPSHRVAVRPNVARTTVEGRDPFLGIFTGTISGRTVVAPGPGPWLLPSLVLNVDVLAGAPFVRGGTLRAPRLSATATSGVPFLFEPLLMFILADQTSMAGAPTVTGTLEAPALLDTSAAAGTPFTSQGPLTRPLAVRFPPQFALPPTAFAELEGTAMQARVSAGAPTARWRWRARPIPIELIVAGVPRADGALPAPQIDQRRAAGTPIIVVGLREPTLAGQAGAGVPTAASALRESVIGGTFLVGAPTAAIALQRQNLLRVMPQSAGVPDPYVNLRPIGIAGATVVGGLPAVPAPRLTAPPFSRYVESGIPRIFIELAGGARDSFFRFLPDERVTRRRQVSFAIPRAANEGDGGTYIVTGLPDGLTFDPETLLVTGETDVAPGDYVVRVEFRDAAPT